MKSIESLSGRCLIILLLVGTMPGLLQAAVNRKDVVEHVRSINAIFDSGDVNVWINNNDPDPGVKVGEQLQFTITSKAPKHFLMILVDPKGEGVIVDPDGLDDQSIARTSYVYPPPGTGQLTQGEPVGIESVFVLAFDKPVSKDILRIPVDSDMAALGSNLGDIVDFTQLMSTISVNNPLSIASYQYFVDADVQFGTRAVRRELAARVQQVDTLAENQSSVSAKDAGSLSMIESEPLSVSAIKFETNSTTLTSRGRVQLDVFGSELVNLWDTSGLPNISLEGHTDDTGSSSYNLLLSKRRAQAAKSYLVTEFGLPSDKIAARGMGEREPLVENVDSDSRARNRRVEIAVSN
jgi:outer membrane protein OmpA-like peptidoglycan-associated protein